MRRASKEKQPGIFVSYRRSDNPDATGRIYDRLVAEFGKARVFKDVDSIPLGEDFRSHLNQIVGRCAVMLAIIGPKWSDARTVTGQRRLEETDDFVRIELEVALARDIPVVPILVAHAPMPSAAELPSALGAISFRQSIEVRPDPDFHHDVTRLTAALHAILNPNIKLRSGGDAAAGNLAYRRRQAWPRSWWPLALVTALAIVLAVPALRHLRERPNAEIRSEITMPVQAEQGVDMALSPDGRLIVFVAAISGVPRLWLRALDTTVAKPLAGTDGASRPFWSPDSRSIGFFTASALMRLDVRGGTPIPIATVVNGTGGSWSSNGSIIFGQGLVHSLGRVVATGGAVTDITHPKEELEDHWQPVVLPDGRRFLFISTGGKNSSGIYLGSLDGADPVRLTTAIGSMALLPDAWLLIWDGAKQSLIAQRLDVDKGVLTGDAVTLADGASGVVSASSNGLIAYWPHGVARRARHLQWRSRMGADLGSIGEAGASYLSPRVSPDGRRVVVAVRGDLGNQDIWLLDADHARRLTFDGAENALPLFSLDGTQILFCSARPGARGLYQIPVDGAGEETLVLRSDAIYGARSWTPDGRFLLYVQVSPKTSADIGILPMTGERKPWMFLDSPFTEGGGEFSPDGKWVAYHSNETGQMEVFVRPFTEQVAKTTARLGKWQISTAGGSDPKWSPNGRELFFLDKSGEMMVAPISYSNQSLAPGTPAALFKTRVAGGGQNQNGGPQFDLARDGRFLINEVSDTATSEASSIVLIENWSHATQ